MFSPDAVSLLPLVFLLSLSYRYLGQSTSLDPMVLYSESAAFFHGGLREVERTGTRLHPPGLYVLNAIGFALFGKRPLSYNLVGILLFTGVSIYAYRFVRRRLGRRVAIPFVLLLFCNPMLVINSIYLSNDALILFAIILFTIFYFEQRLVLAALTMALMVLMKESAIVAILPLLGYSLFRVVHTRFPQVRRRALSRTVDLFLPAAAVFVSWRLVLYRFHLSEWRDVNFVKGNQNSYIVLLKKLASFKIWDIFLRQNLRNAFIFNFQWVYVLVLVVLAAVLWKRLARTPVGIRRLLLLAIATAAVYVLLVFTFPTFTIPRYGLPVYFALFLVLAFLLGRIPWTPVYGVLAGGLVALTLVSNAGSFDHVSRHFGQRTLVGQTFYALSWWNSGTDGIFYNTQFLRLAAEQDRVLHDAIAANADAIIIYDNYFKMCEKVFYDIDVRNEFHPDLRVRQPLACLVYGDLDKPWAKSMLTGRTVFVQRDHAGDVIAQLTRNRIAPSRVIVGD